METFIRAGFDEGESKTLMLKAVQLANEARVRFQQHASKEVRCVTEQGGHQAFVALPLGPLGATLQPTQEFQGYCPPTYGPYPFIPDGPNKNRFDNLNEELIAISALAQFHLNRLTLFAADRKTWDSIDCIAFETVPLCREVTAIRRAMGHLQKRLIEENRKSALKPWWISCVFPNGESPEDACGIAGGKVQIDDLLDAAYRNVNTTKSLLAVPSGFRINCTSLDYIRPLSIKIREYYKTLDINKEPPRG